MQWLKILMFLPLLAVNPAIAAEGVEVTASVDRNQVGVGDVINLVVSVSAQNSINVEQPQLPDIPGLELINESSGMETRSSYTNGQFITQQARNFTYMMAILKPGFSLFRRIPGVPTACTAKKPPVTRNPRERRNTRASPRRSAAWPARKASRKAPPPTAKNSTK